MNKTVIEVAALVFGVLLLIALFLLYTNTGNAIYKQVTSGITSYWDQWKDKTPSTILPTSLADAKVLIASL